MTMDNIDRPEIMKTFKKIGMSQERWKKTIETGIKRLRRKLRHAYDKYILDSRRIITLRGTIREQMKHTVPIATELFFNF